MFRSDFQPIAAWVQPAKIPLLAHGTQSEVTSTTPSASGEVLADSLEYGTASVERSSDTAATIAVQTPKPGLLAWSTAWDPGWRAELTPVNGRPRPVAIKRIGFVLGVSVPAGKSVVQFTYVPPHWSEGVTISLVSLFGLTAISGGIVVLGRVRRRSRLI